MIIAFQFVGVQILSPIRFDQWKIVIVLTDIQVEFIPIQIQVS